MSEYRLLTMKCDRENFVSFTNAVYISVICTIVSKRKIIYYFCFSFDTLEIVSSLQSISVSCPLLPACLPDLSWSLPPLLLLLLLLTGFIELEALKEIG